MIDKKIVKVGINGFGRIGRTIFRQIRELEGFEVVQINDLNSDIHNICYLLNYDSVHGTLSNKAEVKKDSILVDGTSTKVSSSILITDAGWDKQGVDILIESSGYKPNIPIIRKCLTGTVKKVLFSDSPEGMDITISNGANEYDYDHSNHHIVSSSICDVIGTAPVLRLIEDEYGIESAFLQTLHPWLNYQNIMDGSLNTDVIQDPQGKAYGIGRASASNLIPKNTSLGKALLKVLPSLEGKISSMSYRVPTEIIGSCSMVLDLNKKTNTENVKKFLKKSENIPILAISDDPIVSIDVKHHESSCVLDLRWVEVLNNKLRLVTWYDNEWGYVNRLIENLKRISGD
tara:strand:- start:306 stop:1340 length:1035 start_codon:yes stop_codon:yes gene_type:complete